MTASVLNRVLLILSLIGLFVAGMLVLESTIGLQICGGNNDCRAVSEHPSAYWGPFPVAFFGVFGYLVLALLAFLRGTDERYALSLTKVGTLVSLIGVIASAHLQIASFFVIGKKCPWCIASAILMTLIFVGHVVLLQRVKDPERRRLAPQGGVFALGGGLVVLGLMGAALALERASATPLTEVASSKIIKDLIPNPANSIGAPNAPIQIVEFSDMACPTCQQVTPMVHKFAEQNGDKVRLVYRHLPLVKLHETAEAASAISEVAADEKKFFPYVLAVMNLRKGGDTTIDDLMTVAEAIGLSREKIQKRLGSPKDPVYARISRDVEAAKAMGVTGTPTFFIKMPDGKMVKAVAEEVMKALDSPEIKRILVGGA